MMHEFLNGVKAKAQMANQGKSTRQGTISGYDPSTYSVKVTIQPDGVLTGWIPLKSVWIGNGWGLFSPPSIGDAVEIDYQEADGFGGSVGLRFFNDQDRPLPCPSGEFWLVHESGASFKSTNDGKLTLTDPSGTVVSLTNDGNLTITGNLIVSGNTVIKGNTEVDGTTLSKGAFTGQGGMAVSGGNGATVDGSLSTTRDVKAGNISLKDHVHSGVQGGNSTTGGPK
jgi:hypothetical protein